MPTAANTVRSAVVGAAHDAARALRGRAAMTLLVLVTVVSTALVPGLAAAGQPVEPRTVSASSEPGGEGYADGAADGAAVRLHGGRRCPGGAPPPRPAPAALAEPHADRLTTAGIESPAVAAHAARRVVLRC
ncbi:hypothetical protein [Streptomyces sp. SAJ15]|uniref:hypothetical protein n=1 Tax=Streptomyces sp. SAJ15 TaxID=2011095 RepID=UPI00118539BA|nr:hypothetical protein [Streptomyces sp. SAJ15]